MFYSIGEIGADGDDDAVHVMRVWQVVKARGKFMLSVFDTYDTVDDVPRQLEKALTTAKGYFPLAVLNLLLPWRLEIPPCSCLQGLLIDLIKQPSKNKVSDE